MQLLKICKQIVKLAKAQISKILQLGEYFGSCLANLGEKKALINVAVPLTRENFPGLVSNLTFKYKRSCQMRKRIYFTYFK